MISPASGTYYAQQTVSITDATAASPLYYTLDWFDADGLLDGLRDAACDQHFEDGDRGRGGGARCDESEASATYTIVGSPAVLAGPATAVGTTGATLNAYVNTAGVAGSYLFRYGTSSTALTTNTAWTVLSASATRATASATVTTLAAKTKYYYQVKVITAGGTTVGAVQSFTTN